MDEDGILQTIADKLPETILVAAGVLAVLIALTYVRDKDSFTYKFFMVLGTVAGAIIIYEAATRGAEWATFTCAVVAVAGFTLVIRPFRNVDFAIVLGIIAAVIAYIYLGDLTGDLEVLSEGTPRIVVALIAGAFVYMMFNFLQKVAMLIGKILNWWPFLLIIGIVCLVEGALMLSGNGSILDIYHRYADSAESVIPLL